MVQSVLSTEISKRPMEIHLGSIGWVNSVGNIIHKVAIMCTHPVRKFKDKEIAVKAGLKAHDMMTAGLIN